MIRIDRESIKDLALIEPGTELQACTEGDETVLHSRWFVFQLPRAEIEIVAMGDGLPGILKWKHVIAPEGMPMKKGSPRSFRFGADETIVQFTTDDPAFTAFMRSAVFTWIQTVFDSPEFWVRKVDDCIAIRDNGKLIGGVGPVNLDRTTSEQQPEGTVAGT